MKDMTKIRIGVYCAIIMLIACQISCSKDSPKVSTYQLEGTWMLYERYSAGGLDSIYDLSGDNQLVFTPRIYWRYLDGNVTDSGSYTISEPSEANGIFSANIQFSGPVTDFLTIHGDSLTISSPGFAANHRTYIKSDEASVVN